MQEFEEVRAKVQNLVLVELEDFQRWELAEKGHDPVVV